MLNFSGGNLTATAPGDYYEATKVEYSASENITCGIFTRYYVAPTSQKHVYFNALRCADGKVTAKTLDAGLWRAPGIQSLGINQ